MGKRKERHLAALSNAGRRVKLDLFAEPSEDLGGYSVHEEVDGEPKQHAGLPNSPSSSGQQPANPLLLLGQYSDDELDDQSDDVSDKRLEHGTLDGSISDHDDLANGLVTETCKDIEADAVEDANILRVGQEIMEKGSTENAIQDLVVGISREGDIIFPSESVKKNDPTEQISVAGTSEVQVIGHVGSGWRIVMHEESNQYYYWNIETGDTSWEVPNVLHQINQSTSDQKALTVESTETAQMGVHDLKSIPSSQSIGGSLILQNKVSDNEPKLDEQDRACKNEVLKDKNWISDGNGSEFQLSSDAVDTRLAGGTLDGSGNYTHDVFANDENKTGIDLSTHLLKQGQCLLERLKSLKVSENNLQDQVWMSKYIFEVETRLSDIKSLLSYGSSLSPFWAHCERQLKRLEGIINDKIYQLAKSAVMEEAEEAPAYFEEKPKTEEGSHNEVELVGKDINAVSSIPKIFDVSTDVDTLTVVNSDVNNQVSSMNAAYMVNVPSFGLPAEHFESEAQTVELVDGDTLSGEANSKTGGHVVEDVDMDVDMEVEDAIPASTIALKDVSPNALEQLNPSADYSAVPPPPDEEWIPPPPPDNEQVPPPPPDNEPVPPPPPPNEPPEHSYPSLPSYLETTPLAYAEQYNLAYSDSSYQYYGHVVNEVPVGGFYGCADGCQIPAPQASLYYQAVSNAYSESAPVAVNPAEVVIFYDLQGRRASSVPIASGTESCQLHSEVGTICRNTLASNEAGSDDDLAVAGPGARGNVSTVTEKTEVASVGISSTSSSVEAPAIISVKENLAAAAAAAAASAAASSSAPKVQSKAARTKKRTVAVASSLRSNKKVSSLVDKWKAAKEELHENVEDEPENAYEILEKKRQREIEEWYAWQLASGEAKDNPNFQPLGGDWREKVKRRRAQKAKKFTETPLDVLPDGNQEPDLDELSRDLPPGWQAYWDESSKQVYYGHVNTSETTWIRPTKYV